MLSSYAHVQKVFISLIIFIVFTMKSTSAFSEIEKNYEMSMNCKVTGQSITQMTDGRIKTYESYSDDLEVGDTFTIDYYFFRGITVSIRGSNDVLSPFKLLLGGGWTGPIWKDKNIIEFDAENRRIEMSEMHRSRNVPYEYMHWSEDQITFGWAGERLIKLQRYYKTDWHGMYVNLRPNGRGKISSHMYSFDCRHTSDDKFNELLDISIEQLSKVLNE